MEWRAISRILVSHMHPDHVGGAARARKLSGAPVAMHPAEAKLVGPRPPGEEFFVRTAEYLASHGVPAEAIDEMREQARPFAAKIDRFTPDEELLPGDHMAYSSGRLETLLTPGHSPALLCFHEPNRKILFSTDVILEKITPNIGVHPFYGGNPLGEYFDSLAKLEELDIETVVPSHGSPFSGHREWIATTRKHHRRRCDKAAEAVANKPLHGYDVAGAIWGENRGAGDRRMAMAEGLAHLEFLARSGRVERFERDGVVYWKAL